MQVTGWYADIPGLTCELLVVYEIGRTLSELVSLPQLVARPLLR